jgi:ABC-type transport system involved in multi-copper enzyme maturation permease subunit
MKFKITPFLIVFFGLILYGIYMMVSGSGGNLGPLVVITSILISALFLILYLIFIAIFKTRIWKQVMLESVILMIIAFIIYNNNAKTFLNLPSNFQGYIILVYEVKDMPEIKCHSIFNPNSDVTVPENGIIYTSSKRVKNIRVVDRSNGSEKILVPGYGISFASDTLRCDKNEYALDIIYFAKDWTGWEYNSKSDRANRILKKDLACKLLSE